MKILLCSLTTIVCILAFFFTSGKKTHAQGVNPIPITITPPAFFPTLPATPTPFPTFPLPSGPCRLDANGNCLEIATAIGYIPADATGFVKTIFTLVLSIAGGIALILIMISGYTLMLARGDPEKLEGAKETLTSAIVGLLFIIFSLVILQVIGIDILGIPGFTR